MAIRGDFSINWDASPRVITILAPSTECTMQDLLDTLRHLESRSNAMDNKPIVDASGKEILDAITKVGITVTLQNAIVGFEARSGPLWTICSLVGGNLVSKDEVGVVIESTNPTAFVTIKAQSSSSATLQEQDALQYSSYGGQVSLDRDSTFFGTEYPVGNMQYPVDNAVDAVIIANTKGFRTIGIYSNYNFVAGDNISKKKIHGVSHISTYIDMGYDAECFETVFEDINITGILDGDSEINNCVAKDIVYFNGHIHNSALGGLFTLGGSVPAKFVNCSMADMRNPTIIDCGGSGQDAIIDYKGHISIQNLTGDNLIGISMSGGVVTLDSTCTAGLINIQGNYELIDNSGAECTVITTEKLMVHDDITEINLGDVDLSTIPQAVWEYVTRELTVAAGLTPEQEEKLDKIIIDIQNIECEGGTSSGNEWVVSI